jgi:O-antigen/teichoic acid export membrane protein
MGLSSDPAANARTILAAPMASRVLWRRSATAIGVYTATVLGFLTTVVATKELGGGNSYATFAAVFAATTFFQVLFDLTFEEALVKYGFRYTESQQWGRLRRLFQLAIGFKLAGAAMAGLAMIALAPFATALWSAPGGVLVPMLIAATLPLLQAPETIAAGAIILRGRYDIRAAFLAFSMGVRLPGLAIGCQYGVVGAVIGLVVAQIIATSAICLAGLAAFRRFPSAPAEPIAEDTGGLRSFLVKSTVVSSLVSGRASLATALLPTVAPIVQAGYFRNAQAPATGFAALSGPARLVLLTEQTRDFEAGRHERMYRMLRRYIRSTTVAMVVIVPVLWWFMPFFMGLAYGETFRAHATDAARLVLLAAALQFIWGWTKSFPVSIGRPGLRIVAQTVEIAVFVPLLLLFASKWGATGAAGASLASTVVFCALWSVLLVRLRKRTFAPEAVPT